MTEYTGNGWTIRSGRWQESPPDEVDHCISDPPFTAHVSKHAKQREGLRGRFTSYKDQDRPTACVHPGRDVGAGAGALSFDGVEVADIGPSIVANVLRWSVLFCAIEQIGDWQRACPSEYVRGGWWSKTNGTPQFSGDRPAVPGEAIAILHARLKNHFG